MESYNYENLPEEIIKEIMNEEDPETIISNCRTNKKLLEICKDSYFWLNYAKGLNHPDFQRLLIILSDYKIFKPLNELLPTEDKEKRNLPIVDFHIARYLWMVIVENEVMDLVPKLRPYIYQDEYFDAHEVEDDVLELKNYVRAINRAQDPKGASRIAKPDFEHLSAEYQSKYIMDNVEEDKVRGLFIFNYKLEKYGLSDGITDSLLTYWSKTGDWNNLLFFINEIYPRIPKDHKSDAIFQIKGYSPISIIKKICKEDSLPEEFLCNEDDFYFGSNNIDTTLYQIETVKEGISFPGNKFLLDFAEVYDRLSTPEFGIYPETYIRVVKQYITKERQISLFKNMKKMFAVSGYTMAALLCEKEINKV